MGLSAIFYPKNEGPNIHCWFKKKKKKIALWPAVLPSQIWVFFAWHNVAVPRQNPQLWVLWALCGWFLGVPWRWATTTVAGANRQKIFVKPLSLSLSLEPPFPLFRWSPKTCIVNCQSYGPKAKPRGPGKHKPNKTAIMGARKRFFNACVFQVYTKYNIKYIVINNCCKSRHMSTHNKTTTNSNK